MNWSDEHYVKLYTRPTLTWRSWGWEARTVFLHIVKVVDHSGFIETGRMDPVDALVLQLDLPKSVVGPGLAELVECGTAELVDRAVLLPKFVEAQEARKSETQRKKDFREREVARRRSQIVEVVGALVPCLERDGTPLDSPAQPSPALLKAMSTSVVDGPAERVFDAWRRATKKGRAVLDAKRRRIITARLAEGHTEADLLAAIDGYARSPHHQGENDRRTKYLALDLWLRDTEHVEAGMAMAPAAPSTVPATEENTAIPEGWQ